MKIGEFWWRWGAGRTQSICYFILKNDFQSKPGTYLLKTGSKIPGSVLAQRNKERNKNSFQNLAKEHFKNLTENSFES